ncbi:MAG: hypothetical protein ACQET7_03200 [Thermodesulfobacteriota bacterium]
MNNIANNPIVDLVGEEFFSWLSRTFSRETTLMDVPAGILERISRVDVTRRDYASDPNAVTAIALLTFAYGMAGKRQEARHGPNDLMLVKALSRGELARRSGEKTSGNPLWKTPLHELITGNVGERIRAARFITNPVEPGE